MNVSSVQLGAARERDDKERCIIVLEDKPPRLENTPRVT